MRSSQQSAFSHQEKAVGGMLLDDVVVRSMSVAVLSTLRSRQPPSTERNKGLEPLAVDKRKNIR